MHGKGGSKKGGASNGAEEGGASNVRTAQNTAINDAALASLRGEKTSGESPTINVNTSNPSGTGSGTGAGGSSKSGPNVIGGALSLTKKYHKKVGGAVLGTGLGVTGAMLGFAGGVAQGDIGAALKGAAAGGVAGKGLGQRVANGINVGNIKSSINNIQDTFNEGAYGAEQAQNMAEMREFKSGSAYQSLKEKYGENFTDDKLSAMLQAGIKDKKDIEKVLNSGNTSDAIGYYTLAKQCPDSIYYDDKKLQMYLEDLGLSQNDAKTMRENMRQFRH